MAAVSGQGTIFSRNSTAVSEIVSISGPGKTRETIEVTRLEDTDGYGRFIGGLRDPGNVTLEMNFDRTGFDLFNGDFESDQEQEYSIAFPDVDNTVVTFNGLVTEVPIEVPIGDKIGMSVTIKVSGAVTVSGSSGA